MMNLRLLFLACFFLACLESTRPHSISRRVRGGFVVLFLARLEGGFEVLDSFPQTLPQLRNLVHAENEDHDEKDDKQLLCAETEHKRPPMLCLWKLDQKSTLGNRGSQSFPGETQKSQEGLKEECVRSPGAA